MYLKKFYKKEDLERWTQERDEAQLRLHDKIQKEKNIPDGKALTLLVQEAMEKEAILPPEIDYISLAHTGTEQEQHFPIKLVTEYLQKGFMKIQGDELIFHVYPEPLHFEILRRPGRYCLHCGENLMDGTTGGDLSRLHVAENHTGKSSPDPINPSGYELINYFDVVLDAKQHSKYKKTGHPVITHFPRKEQV